GDLANRNQAAGSVVQLLPSQPQGELRLVVLIGEQVHVREQLIEIEVVPVNDVTRTADPPADRTGVEFCKRAHAFTKMEVKTEHVALLQIPVGLFRFCSRRREIRKLSKVLVSIKFK